MSQTKRRWTSDEEEKMHQLFQHGQSHAEIGAQLGRSAYAIECRFALLALKEEDPKTWAQTHGVSDATLKKIQGQQKKKAPKTTQIIYVLHLEQNKWYVGKTTNLEQRLKEHGSGAGSAWTKSYPMVKLEKSVKSTSDFDEDKYVKEYMAKYGIQNVRGGSYSTIKLTTAQIKFIAKEIQMSGDFCYLCGAKGHFANTCYLKRLPHYQGQLGPRHTYQTSHQPHYQPPDQPPVQPPDQPPDQTQPRAEENECVIC